MIEKEHLGFSDIFPFVDYSSCALYLLNYIITKEVFLLWQWCTHKGLMAVNTIANVFILSEHVMSASFHSQTAVVQYAPSSLSIELFQSGSYHDLKTDVQVKGVYTTKVRCNTLCPFF